MATELTYDMMIEGKKKLFGVLPMQSDWCGYYAVKKADYDQLREGKPEFFDELRKQNRFVPMYDLGTRPDLQWFRFN